MVDEDPVTRWTAFWNISEINGAEGLDVEIARSSNLPSDQRVERAEIVWLNNLERSCDLVLSNVPVSEGRSLSLKLLLRW